MNWKNVRLIFQRELRDQLRDRRTLFMIAVLPLLLYPLIGVAFMQVSQFLKKTTARVQLVVAEPLIDEPALLDGDQFVDRYQQDAENLELQVRRVAPHEISKFSDLNREQLDSLGCDAVVVFPLGFSEQLASLRRLGNGDSGGGGSGGGGSGVGDGTELRPRIYFDATKERSLAAYRRVSSILDDWRHRIVNATLLEHRVPLRTATPFEVVPQDVAPADGVRAALWSKVLPFIVLIWAMTGAFYPAVDLCAGEKERGTLETLLSGPAERVDIVWGKLLTIMVFSLCTALLNLVCLLLTASLIVGQLQGLAPQGAAFALGPPPMASLGWLLCALLPMSALFSALSLAFATMARSTKEGQYYLMPLFLVSMPLMMLAILPSTELDLGTSLIPLTGVVLLLRYLIEGQYGEALLYTAPVILVTAGCCWVAIRWAVDQFNDETVLFRESERFNPSTWLAHLVRERGPTPSVAEAIFCGLLILVIRSFAGLGMDPIDSWSGFVKVAIISVVAFVATPALIMTVMLTTSPRQTLSLYLPSWKAIGAAALLAISIHPLAIGTSALIRKLYPIPFDLDGILAPTKDAPSLAVLLLVIAVLPAICEELAFRGFILSGLRHTGSKWRAIAISSIFFGMAHGIIQQSLLAACIGMVLGYIAIQAGSILPGMVFHGIHNGLAICSMDWIPRIMQRYPQAHVLFQKTHDAAQLGDASYVYTWPVIVAAAVATYLLLRWFRGLPFQPSAEERLHEALDRQIVLQNSFRS